MSKVFVATYYSVYPRLLKKVAGISAQPIGSFGFITNKSASS